MKSSYSQEASRWKPIVARIVCVGIVSVSLAQWARAQGASSGFAVLSSSDVTLKNRVNINQVSVSPASCPGSAGCPGNVGGTTILMGRGNAAAPDMISGGVIASANASQGLNCSNNPPGTTAICLGNDSEIAGACVTGGGAVSSPSECAHGTDTSGASTEVTTLLPQAISDAASFSSTLAAMTATQALPAVVLGTRGQMTISSSGGPNVVSVPSITTGTNSTLTLNGAPTDTFVINIGSATDAGSLQLGNGASVLLSGGITPDRVIFNLIGTGTTAQLGNHTVFNGSLLAPQGEFTSGDGDTPSPVLINGALLFGGSIAIGNNTNLNFYPFVGVGGGSTM
ncbi:MAG: choice-of-anchor A family protein [Terriglobales bacterium]